VEEGRALQVEGRALQVEGLALQVEGRVLQVEGWALQVEGWVMQVVGRAMQVVGQEYRYVVHVLGSVLSIHHQHYQHPYCWFALLEQVRRGTGILQHLQIDLFSISGCQKKNITN
jgi:hypothetical protein